MENVSDIANWCNDPHLNRSWKDMNCHGNGDNGTSMQFNGHRTFLTLEVNVTLYSLIFLLSVCGNALVIVTLFREKKMQTITNMFLLNLAISDLLLSVLCMPFTLVATIILRDFIFGEVMCIAIRYFQGELSTILIWDIILYLLPRQSGRLLSGRLDPSL